MEVVPCIAIGFVGIGAYLSLYLYAILIACCKRGFLHVKNEQRLPPRVTVPSSLASMNKKPCIFFLQFFFSYEFVS